LGWKHGGGGKQECGGDESGHVASALFEMGDRGLPGLAEAVNSAGQHHTIPPPATVVARCIGLEIC
jgi:hypothetical protein